MDDALMVIIKNNNSLHCKTVFAIQVVNGKTCFNVQQVTEICQAEDLFVLCNNMSYNAVICN